MKWMFFSNTHWPQLTAPFYSILFETSIWQFNSSKCSLIQPDEVREHLTRDQRPFLHPCWCFFSSVRLTHFLQGSGQRTGLVIAEAWFCAQWPLFVLFLRFVFGLFSGWKIQTWPIIRFLTESVTYWFFICWYLIESWCRVSKQDVQDLQQKYRPKTSKKYSSIFHCTHGALFIPVFTKPILSVCS